MTDARLPERWLSDRRLLLLTDPAWRLYVTALMFCVANRSDGVFWNDDLRVMPGIDPGLAHDLATACLKAGLLGHEGDRWYVLDFTGSQTSRDELAQLERIREADRLKHQAARRKKAEQEAALSLGRVPVTAQAGQDRQDRQERTGSEGTPHQDGDWP